MKITNKTLRYGLIAMLVLLLFIACVVLLPSPIDALAFTPKNPPTLDGALQPNQVLLRAKRLAEGKLYGPEDVALDDQGRIYAGTQDGKIVRIQGEKIEDFAFTGGRPLGLDFDRFGNLIVCDAYKGLLSIDTAGKITTLATTADGLRFAFTDDLDIAHDGTIYFTDASHKFNQSEYLYDLLEARPHGRFLSYDPKTKRTSVLLSDLYFANGVALSQNEDFVLINETYRYRIRRYYLKGDKAGTSDIFIDNLPGFPDGVSSNDKGIFWVAMFTIRNPQMDAMHASVWQKNLIAKLPKFLWPKPAPYGLILALDETGHVVKSLHDPTGKVMLGITSVEEHQGSLFLGNLQHHWIGRLTFHNKNSM